MRYWTPFTFTKRWIVLRRILWIYSWDFLFEKLYFLYNLKTIHTILYGKKDSQRYYPWYIYSGEAFSYLEEIWTTSFFTENILWNFLSSFLTSWNINTHPSWCNIFYYLTCSSFLTQADTDIYLFIHPFYSVAYSVRKSLCMVEKKKNSLNNKKFLVFYNGGPTGARTRDLRIKSPALYQLSYRSKN